MKALAEIQVIPLGSGVSVRREVTQAYEIIKSAGLKVHLHDYGTNVEGELGAILSAVQRIHEALHEQGAKRLITLLKLGTRQDKEPHLEAATRAVVGA